MFNSSPSTYFHGVNILTPHVIKQLFIGRLAIEVSEGAWRKRQLVSVNVRDRRDGSVVYDLLRMFGSRGEAEFYLAELETSAESKAARPTSALNTRH